MRILVGCEFSGAVRDAFAALGHDAWSCDLLPSETPGNHIQGDLLGILGDGWDLAIFHPPCTHLAVSGARWFRHKQQEQAEALAFVQALLDAPIPRIALENPVSIISSRIRKPDQIIQPWQFGHGETKATCLWLKNLPPLVPTEIVEGREARVHRMPPGPDRWKERSRTFPGIAAAMAAQWSSHLAHIWSQIVMLFVELRGIPKQHADIHWALIHSGPRVLRRIVDRYTAIGTPVRHIVRSKSSVVLCSTNSAEDPCNFVHASPEENDGALRRQVARAFGDVVLSGTEAA